MCGKHLTRGNTHFYGTGTKFSLLKIVMVLCNTVYFILYIQYFLYSYYKEHIAILHVQCINRGIESYFLLVMKFS